MSLPANAVARGQTSRPAVPRRPDQDRHRRQPEDVLRLPAHAGLRAARSPPSPLSHPAVRSGEIELFVLPASRHAECSRGSSAWPGAAPARRTFPGQTKARYTGEVSGRTMSELGGRYAEVGHAERRRIFGEADRTIGLKTVAAYRNGLTPVLCVGELRPGSGRKPSGTAPRTSTPRSTGHGRLGPAARTIVAYEPQWAIGAAEPRHSGAHQHCMPDGRAPARAPAGPRAG